MNKEKKVIRLGTRKSPLAMAQARLAAEAIERAFPELTAELVPIVTRGDRILDRPLVEFGGKGAFISEFERALLEGRIDGAVHSAKDMPEELAIGHRGSASQGGRRRRAGDCKGKAASGRAVSGGDWKPPPPGADPGDEERPLRPFTGKYPDKAQ